MKYIKIALYFSLLCGCKSYSWEPQEISSIYIVFNGQYLPDKQQYVLANDITIPWDRRNENIKNGLKKLEKKYSTFTVKSGGYLFSHIINCKKIKYYPIKVLPLKEFGYIKLKNQSLIYYGLTKDSIFIDLSNNIVYLPSKPTGRNL